MQRTEKSKTATLQSRGRPRTFDREKALLRALDVFWEFGYEPASISELCSRMEINPPSLYAAFGNKAQLFLEAADYYERVFWTGAHMALEKEPDISKALAKYFSMAANILTSPAVPCGCLIVLAAINVSAESQPVIDAIKQLRHETWAAFHKRLSRAVTDGQLSKKSDIKALATTLHALIEGMSIQARDGVSQTDLKKISKIVTALLPT